MICNYKFPNSDLPDLQSQVGKSGTKVVKKNDIRK